MHKCIVLEFRNMNNINLFIIKTLLLLWVVCVVLCEHQKRDVHHRIVIKQRIPRSHKKGRSHVHGQHHHSGRSKGHGHKKGKKQVSSYEEETLEDDRSQSRSRENGFEDVFQKPQKSRKPHHRDTKSHSAPSYFINQDFEETKQVPYKDYSKLMFQNAEWVPLSSEQVHHQVSHETYRDRQKRKRNNKKNYLSSLKPPPVDLTTSYPVQFESSSVFPQIIDYSNAFANFNLNQKIIESNQSPLIGTIEQPKIEFPEIKSNYGSMLQNHQTSYEVTELTPSGSKSNTLISVPDDTISEHSIEEVAMKSTNQKKEEKITQKPVRSRGRFSYRGQKNVQK